MVKSPAPQLTLILTLLPALGSTALSTALYTTAIIAKNLDVAITSLNSMAITTSLTILQVHELFTFLK